MGHKVWITIVTSIFIFFSGYYALTTTKQYTATAIFEIEQSNSSGLNIPSEIGALASLAGLNNVGNLSSEILMERILEREFILQVVQSLSLQDDPFFQTYNPNAVDPIWMAKVKKLIGWEMSDASRQYIIDSTLQENYLEYVQTSQTPAGAIEISVTHENPNLASEYANQIMELVRQTVSTEEENLRKCASPTWRKHGRRASRYGDSAENIKNFTLENSAAAQENFIVGSLQLDSLRLERSEAEQFLFVLETLQELVKLGDLDMSTYEALRVRMPLVDDLDFRRIMGMSETISSWSWPTLDTIESVSETLSDRISRLDVDIANIEESAISYAASAEDQAKLFRDAKLLRRRLQF